MAKGQESIAIVHTSFALVEVLGALVEELLPDVRCINIIDDSLLADVMREGKVCTDVARRMCQYFLAAEEAKAGAVLNACSTVSETVDIARPLLRIPIIKVDEPMAELAVQTGERIGVVATVPTTIGPTCRLIERKAKELNKQAAISSSLLEGGFELLMAGQKEKHDKSLMQLIKEVAQQNDVVVLAQASMARLMPQLDENLRHKVLSSPRSGMEAVKQALHKRGH